jgi:hypothetical protein
VGSELVAGGRQLTCLLFGCCPIEDTGDPQLQTSMEFHHGGLLGHGLGQLGSFSASLVEFVIASELLRLRGALLIDQYICGE